MLMYLSAFKFPSTFISVPTPLYQMHPHTMTLNLQSVFPFTKSGLHPSPRFLHTYTRLSCPKQTCDLSMNITLLHWYWVVHHLFSLHHANHFFLLSNLTTTFFLHTLLENQWSLKRHLTVRLDTLPFLSSLNLSVI